MQSSVDGNLQNCPVTKNGRGVFCVTVLRAASNEKDQSVLVEGTHTKVLDFQTVLKKLKLDENGSYVFKASWLEFNASTARLETKGSVEVDASVAQGNVLSDLKLHHPVTGEFTGVNVSVKGVEFKNEGHTLDVQKNAKRRAEIMNSGSFGRALAQREMRTLRVLSNFIHWYLSLMCGTAVHRVIEGQPFINAFLDSDPQTAGQWWDSAMSLAEKLFCKRNAKDYSKNELDSIGMSAITLLVGPYTIPQDAIDGRNTKWASYNENGDCDKDALTAAAIYTMLRFGRSIEEFCSNPLGKKILRWWKESRGAAIMCHVTASAETALGQTGSQDPTCGPEMGHCIWGVLPNMKETCNLRMTEKDIASVFEKMKNDEKPKFVLFGEATRPTTANPLIVAQGASSAEWKEQFEIKYPNLRYGNPNMGGWGEIKLLDSTQYPHVMQIYTAGGCCFTKTIGTTFPKVCDVFAARPNVELGAMSSLFSGSPELEEYHKSDVWKEGTRFDPHNERQDIKEITHKSVLVTGIDEGARLCNPRRQTFKDRYTSDQVITVGAATFGVFKKKGKNFVDPHISTVLQQQKQRVGRDHTLLLSASVKSKEKVGRDHTKKRVFI